jgi:hypothetical protein
MTLIIGILCTDGIVVGSDSEATYGTMGQRTIRQEDFSKLQVICDDKAIIGVSGPVGLAQRIAGEIERMYVAKEIVGKPFEAMASVRLNIWNKHISPEMQVAAVARNAIGPVANDSAICATLLAIPVGGEACLFLFDQQGAPEQAKDNIMFYAIGSGELSADPFLAFLRRTFWKGRKPSLQDGIFTALWTLEYVIQSDPGGVGGQPRICVLEMKGHDWVARHMQDPELAEQRQIVATAEEHLRGFALPDLTGKGRKPGGSPPPK